MIGKTNASVGGSAAGGTTNPSNGVYILADDGKYYTTDEWMTKYVAVLVAVITDNCQFGIALEDATIKVSNSYTESSFSFGKSSGTIYSTESTAITDYDGLGNTSKISHNYRDYDSESLYGRNSASRCAADAARNYEFSDGRLGYLGALGEWKAVIDNISAINKALSYAGCNVLSQTGYCTSTKYDSDSGWVVKYKTITTGGGLVRAFCKLNKDEGFKTKTFIAATTRYSTYYEFEPGMTWIQWAASSYAPSNSAVLYIYDLPSSFGINISGSSWSSFPMIVPSDTNSSEEIIGGLVHLKAESENDLA